MSFIFPLCWQHTLIPILPACLVDYLHSPYIYLIGIESHLMNMLGQEHPDEKHEDVTEVKLDANAIYTAERELSYTKMP